MGALKKVYSRIDELTTTFTRLFVDKIQAYKTSYNLGDFTSDDDIPNMSAVRAVASQIPEISVPIDADPKTYEYTGSRDFPQIRFSYVDGSGNLHPNTYDFSYVPGTKIITFDIPVSDGAVAYVS